jgi:hypothetical protein
VCRLQRGGDVYGRSIITINNTTFRWSCISNYHNYCLNNCTRTYIKQIKKQIHTLLAIRVCTF